MVVPLDSAQRYPSEGVRDRSLAVTKSAGIGDDPARETPQYA
jgi:hypothetical protein